MPADGSYQDLPTSPDEAAAAELARILQSQARLAAGIAHAGEDSLQYGSSGPYMPQHQGYPHPGADTSDPERNARYSQQLATQDYGGSGGIGGQEYYYYDARPRPPMVYAAPQQQQQQQLTGYYPAPPQIYPGAHIPPYMVYDQMYPYPMSAGLPPSQQISPAYMFAQHHPPMQHSQSFQQQEYPVHHRLPLQQQHQQHQQQPLREQQARRDNRPPIRPAASTSHSYRDSPSYASPPPSGLVTPMQDLRGGSAATMTPSSSPENTLGGHTSTYSGSRSYATSPSLGAQADDYHSSSFSSAATSHARPPRYNTPGQQSNNPPLSLNRGSLAREKMYALIHDRPPPQRFAPNARHEPQLYKTLPRPPAHSAWAMWVGNVSYDVTHDELLNFFESRKAPVNLLSQDEIAQLRNKSHADPDGPQPRMTDEDLATCGVESVHLILRSNCAFVNYISDIHLQVGIKTSHGVRLRREDQRCKEFVCRVRNKDDGTKSGVGTQRGKQMHQTYIASKQAADSDQAESQSTVPELTVESDTSARTRQVSTSTVHSSASTSSSFLARHFPKRYFILKSHTEEDLQKAVEHSIWSTQSHNEPVLDRAFRTSREGVFLIFGANGTGEFFGYARMVERILKGDDSRANSRASPHASADMRVREFSGSSLKPSIIPEGDEHGSLGLAASPLPMASPASPQATRQLPDRQASSVPGRLKPAAGDEAPLPSPGGGYFPVVDSAAKRGSTWDSSSLLAPSSAATPNTTTTTPGTVTSTTPSSAGGFARTEAERAAEHNRFLESQARGSPNENEPPASVVTASEEANESSSDSKQTQKTLSGGPLGLSKREPGRAFKVEWLSTTRLPFSQIRHLRNSFNENKEVKISRDGIELEPVVGEELLQAFSAASAPPN
ncbi:uncharacterized protein L969DRAFT_19606 [Mixia osmundae IAM 14324]|uniref:YTH domain-containing protein n=1 Tax=Mixia osmundae (strain CBS 9802 / IAM 14324 / JCM 22182 / KY 12970) TaxID=764103 RepID=G7EB12_MIXOS|nr:uncharacterized protein L969DRAFT_19606 [Mixia osmundae IAM 14324]KEI37057.1 hypothetical protein L969DRAFT_19606 [Mixia osmundae IAM 14324]GAB00023.1 hypothetical protein E5Q_06725 [Mixia osmundae IAM 14324]